jgi:hypothetical protein
MVAIGHWLLCICASVHDGLGRLVSAAAQQQDCSDACWLLVAVADLASAARSTARTENRVGSLMTDTEDFSVNRR